MFFNRKKQTSWAREYKKRTPASHKQTIDNTVFCVIDLETTGFDIHRDRILSIALTRIEKSKIRANAFHEWLVFQNNIKLNDAIKVHGILPSETKTGQSEKEVIKELIPLITETILVGHHIQFDAAMLNISMERHFGLKLRNRLIDTAAMSISELDAFKKSGYSNQKPPSLDEVCSQLSITPIERHTAAGDVFTTAQLFLLLKARYRMRLENRFTLKSLPIKTF